MKAQKFLIYELKKMKEKFDGIELMYHYDDEELTHYIKVVPEHMYKNNKKYIDYEAKVIYKFISEFPDQGIVFYTENDLIDLENENIIFDTRKDKQDIFFTVYNWIESNKTLFDNIEFNETKNDEYSEHLSIPDEFSILFEEISESIIIDIDNFIKEMVTPLKPDSALMPDSAEIFPNKQYSLAA